MSYENESAVLGCGLVDPSTIDIASGIISPEDFADRSLGQAFAILCDLHGAGRPIDHRVTVESLRSAGILDDVGGIAGVANWGIAFSNISNVGEYCRLIKADASRRKIRALAAEIKSRASDPAVDAEVLADWIESQLTSFRASIQEGPQSIGHLVGDAIEHLHAICDGRELPGLPTGLGTVDAVIGGLHPADLIIVAARPSIGKSALGTQIAFHNASEGRPTLFVSLEMTGRDIAVRMLCDALHYENAVLRNGRVDDDDFAEMERYRKSIDGIPFNVWSVRSATTAKIRAIARIQKATAGLSLVVVDYIGLIDGSDKRKPRWEQVGEISKELKSLAKELSVPVVALCQLNREAEHSKPNLGHLRDAGAIEQDADIVMLLHRETRDATAANLHVAKQRNGPVTELTIGFDCQSCKFHDYRHPDSFGEFA